jgi:hypothetical protein
MFAIFSFSDDILIDIIREWSSIRCLVYLDSSLCNHSSRIEFSGLLKHKNLVLFNETYDWTYKGELKYPCHQLYIIGFFNWILRKGVKLFKIKFFECHFVQSDLTLTKLDFSMITYLRFTKFEVTKLSDPLIIIQSCLNLTSLKLCEICKITDSFISKIVLMSKLTELSVFGIMPSLTKTSVEHIANRCNCLKNLSLIYYYRKTRKFALYCPEVIINLLKRNPSLVVISLNLYRVLEPNELSLLSLISTCCYKTINSISLSTIKVITPLDISNCLLNCCNLLFLKLMISNYYTYCKCYLLYQSDVVAKYKHISFYSYNRQICDQFELRVMELLTNVSGFTRIHLQDIPSFLTDDKLLGRIVNHASTLVTLKLESRICTNKSLQIILSTCHNLTTLELNSCHRLDINLIEPIYISNLQFLFIILSPSLRTDTVILFISLSTELKHLEISECNEVDSDAVEEFRAKNMPQLKLIFKAKFEI